MTINLTNATVGPIKISPIRGIAPTETINLQGTDTFDLTNNGGYLTVNMAANSEWRGGFHTTNHRGPNGVTVHGSLGAKFINGHSDVLYTGTSLFDVDVAGTGSFTVSSGATLEFGKSVSAGQEIDLTMGASGATLQIDHAADFHGLVKMDAGMVNLHDLFGASSYSLLNDILSIWSGNNVIDALRLVASGPIAVENTASGVSVFSASLSAYAATQGTALPTHT